MRRGKRVYFLVWRAFNRSNVWFGIMEIYKESGRENKTRKK